MAEGSCNNSAVFCHNHRSLGTKLILLLLLALAHPIYIRFMKAVNYVCTVFLLFKNQRENLDRGEMLPKLACGKFPLKIANKMTGNGLQLTGRADGLLPVSRMLSETLIFDQFLDSPAIRLVKFDIFLFRDVNVMLGDLFVHL